MRQDDPLHYVQDYSIKMEAEFSYNATPAPRFNQHNQMVLMSQEGNVP